jgi:hypothetical protein
VASTEMSVSYELVSVSGQPIITSDKAKLLANEKTSMSVLPSLSVAWFGAPTPTPSVRFTTPNPVLPQSLTLASLKVAELSLAPA